MTRIDAIVRPHNPEYAKDRLVPFSIEDWSVSEVRSLGPQRIDTENLSRAEYSVTLFRRTLSLSHCREARASNFERGEEKEDDGTSRRTL